MSGIISLKTLVVQLDPVAPYGPLKVGDIIKWKNGYGVTIDAGHRIIGFDKVPDANGKYYYMDTDAYWFTHGDSEILTVNGKPFKGPRLGSINHIWSAIGAWHESLSYPVKHRLITLPGGPKVCPVSFGDEDAYMSELKLSLQMAVVHGVADPACKPLIDQMRAEYLAESEQSM